MMLASEADRLDAVVRGVLRPVLKDYAAGTLDLEDVNARAMRQANAIRLAFSANATPLRFICRGCDAEGDAAAACVILGQPYCSGCAPARRPTLPERLR